MADDRYLKVILHKAELPCKVQSYLVAGANDGTLAPPGENN